MTSDSSHSRNRREGSPGDDAIIGRAFRASLVAALIVTAVGIAGWWFTRPRPDMPAIVAPELPAARAPATTAMAVPPSVTFPDVTTAAGIRFVHHNGARGERLLPETMGGGVAFLDYDNDGDQDLLLVNSDDWPEHRGDGPRPTTALYANDGHGHFQDVTAAAGLDRSFYGMGVAAGDYDGDGWRDLFITAVGENHLFRNVQGRFVETTRAAGVAGADTAWGTGAAFFDGDGDGDLDLFVANYVQWSREIDLAVDYRLTGIGRAYGPPTDFAGSHSYLYRNEGDGTFRDISGEAGIQVNNPATGAPMGKGLAIAPLDMDGDGRLDLLVANDTVQNFLFRNLGEGRFVEEGARAGVAFDRDGNATGAMGIDAAYLHGNSRLGVAIGNFANEMTSLYVSPSGGVPFADEAITQGIGPASRLALSFGLFFFDYDLDGRLDLLQVNGHIEDQIHRIQTSQHYEQRPQLFWNAGPQATLPFVAIDPTGSGGLDQPLVGRGAAYADIDGDGDLDVVITQIGRQPALLRNDQRLGHHWLRVKLTGRGMNRDAIGARVELVVGDTTLRREVMPTRSYLSQVELPVTFGLGESRTAGPLTVYWPDGTTQVVERLDVDVILELRQPE